MRVNTDKERSVDAVRASIKANRLTNCENMRFVEGVLEGGPSMTRGAESYALRQDFWVRLTRIIGCHEARNIDQFRRFNRFSRSRAQPVGQSILLS